MLNTLYHGTLIKFNQSSSEIGVGHTFPCEQY